MNTADTINKISLETLQFAPQALGAIAGIEAAAKGLPGQTKSDIAVNVILAAAQTGEAVPVPTVQAVSALVALFVTILNASGLFTHKSKLPTVTLAPQSNAVQGGQPLATQNPPLA